MMKNRVHERGQSLVDSSPLDGGRLRRPWFGYGTRRNGLDIEEESLSRKGG